MSKKNADRKKEEEKDLEEEDEDLEDEDEDEEDEPAAPAAKRARAPAHDADEDHGHGHADDEDEAEDEEDPYWWTPHAVMSVLVLIGVLGMFGVFNKLLAGIAAHPAAAASHDSAPPAKTEPAKTAGARPDAVRPPPAQPHPAPPVPDDVKAAPDSATKTPSGLAYRAIKKGSGSQSPKATDEVSVNYTGWTTDGKMFDSSVTRGQPASFRLNQVIKGWTEGVQLMHVGDTFRFWIPGALAYGDTPKRPGAPAGTLVFDVELLAIK